MDKLWKYIRMIEPCVTSEEAAVRWLDSYDIHKNEHVINMQEVLRLAALANEKDVVNIVLQRTRCSGFLMGELFENELFEIAHHIIQSGRMWGSAFVIFDKDAKMRIEYANSRKYLEWLRLHGYEYMHLVDRVPTHI